MPEKQHRRLIDWLYMLALAVRTLRNDRPTTWSFLLLVMGTAILVPVAYIGWGEIFLRFLETTGPTIEEIEMPRGVGVIPVTCRLRVTDTNSGLDEVVIRSTQKGETKEILRTKLQGRRIADVEVQFDGENSKLVEGEVELNVRAFDRSFWNNKGEKTYRLSVDYRKPRIEVVSAQHNARRGGSQLVFYRAIDQNMGISGVRVGNQSFLGFPASGVDAAFKDQDLYVALYAVPFAEEPNSANVHLFAEDVVGNAVTAQFYNKVLPSRQLTRSLTADEGFLKSTVEPVIEANWSRLQSTAAQIGQKIVFPPNPQEALLAKLRLAINDLYAMDNAEIERSLAEPRFTRYWRAPFSPQAGITRLEFGTKVQFLSGDRPVAEWMQSGYEISVVSVRGEVYATCPGIVTLARDLGVYGKVVVIDHGLGLASVYGYLDDITLRKGDRVNTGDIAGFAGKTGLARQRSIFFQVRVNGVPVDPREWMDSSWFYSHITEKINDVKKSLGLPVVTNYS
jgi:murein DD-endopeptidase MepM/ murein hydrolase activator NlpD